MQPQPLHFHPAPSRSYEFRYDASGRLVNILDVTDLVAPAPHHQVSADVREPLAVSDGNPGPRTSEKRAASRFPLVRFGLETHDPASGLKRNITCSIPDESSPPAGKGAAGATAASRRRRDPPADPPAGKAAATAAAASRDRAAAMDNELAYARLVTDTVGVAPVWDGFRGMSAKDIMTAGHVLQEIKLLQLDGLTNAPELVLRYGSKRCRQVRRWVKQLRDKGQLVKNPPALIASTLLKGHPGRSQEETK